MASLKSLQQPRRGWSGEKGDPFARGHRLPPLAGPSPPLAARSTLAIPYRPKGRRGSRAGCPLGPKGGLSRPEDLRRPEGVVGESGGGNNAGLFSSPDNTQFDLVWLLCFLAF
jgi:hypothetical protein